MTSKRDLENQIKELGGKLKSYENKLKVYEEKLKAYEEDSLAVETTARDAYNTFMGSNSEMGNGHKLDLLEFTRNVRKSAKKDPRSSVYQLAERDHAIIKRHVENYLVWSTQDDPTYRGLEPYFANVFNVEKWLEVVKVPDQRTKEKTRLEIKEIPRSTVDTCVIHDIMIKTAKSQRKKDVEEELFEIEHPA